RDKPRHHIFLEPEGPMTSEVYVNGLSTSLPPDIQYDMLRRIEGLENVKIMRYAYAIEYDYIVPEELQYSLETKKIDGLFLAGQINGTSGYEEAAAQGLVAGINAVKKIRNEKPVILDRTNSYIGTLIDDLVTKGTNEPYRMFTSRTEYRLILREDNADLRLSPLGYKLGLISKEEYDKVEFKRKKVKEIIEKLDTMTVGTTNEALKELLKQRGQPQLKSGATLKNILKRQNFTYQDLKKISDEVEVLDRDIEYQIEVQAKYEGYIQKQLKTIEKQKKLEEKKIYKNINYDEINGITNEAREKLKQVNPINIGQASRISGVSPADISVLLIHMKGLQK
ncbi:MAG: tRNA uridine-5-carboxymethylaminomethyl(34) synthesis enzyme MnmG, partial [Fusobacteriia bacterium 4572_132]